MSTLDITTDELLAGWPEIPPATDAELAAAKRALQASIIGRLAIEIDVCRRVGSDLESRERALEIMLKLYAEGEAECARDNSADVTAVT